MCDWDKSDLSYRGSKNKHAPDGVHIMNKDEAKVMRQLINKTGMTEEKIRQHKKYRVMLSQAQKEGQKAKRTPLQKARDNTMKSVTRKLKLPKEHPDVKKAYVEEWERRRKSWWYRRLGLYSQPPFSK